MDSKHRHELHSNEMVKFIQNFPQIAKDNLTFIIGLCLIILAIFTYGPVRGYMNSKKLVGYSDTTMNLAKVSQGKMQAIQNLQVNPSGVDTSLIMAADSLEIAASKAKTDESAALVQIKRAEAIRSNLHYNNFDLEESAVISDIEKARAAYNLAIAKAGDNVTLKAKAEYGLALCAEEVGDYAKAEEILNAIANNEAYKGTIFVRQAEMRLDKISDYQINYEFADIPEIIEPEFTIPDTTGALNIYDSIGADPGDDGAVISEPIIIEPADAVNSDNGESAEE